MGDDGAEIIFHLAVGVVQRGIIHIGLIGVAKGKHGQHNGDALFHDAQPQAFPVVLGQLIQQNQRDIGDQDKGIHHQRVNPAVRTHDNGEIHGNGKHGAEQEGKQPYRGLPHPFYQQKYKENPGEKSNEQISRLYELHGGQSAIVLYGEHASGIKCFINQPGNAGKG